MKNFNKKIYSLNMQDTALHLPQHEIPMEYYKMASNIANSFSKEYNAIGVLDLNDLTQEGYLALLISWRNIKWNIINEIKNKVDKQKALSKYLKKSITGIVRDRIKKDADGVNLPVKGIWNNKEKKRMTDGFSYVTALFPQWFDTDIINIAEEEVYEYNYEMLGEYIDEWAKKHLPKYHVMLKMLYGIDDIYSKPKKIAEIAKFFSMPMENVKKQKQRLLIKIKNNMQALKELAYFVAIHDIKSRSQVHDFAEKYLQIYRD